jgi:hypothetical protein
MRFCIVRSLEALISQMSFLPTKNHQSFMLQRLANLFLPSRALREELIELFGVL